VRATTKKLDSIGLSVGSIRLSDGSAGGLEAECVVDSMPEAGAWVRRGTKVDLITKLPSKRVVVPNLLGMFEEDAAAALSKAGLRRSGDASPTAKGIVVSQKPSAGTRIPFGGRVSFSAEFPHSLRGSSKDVFRIHGVFYLRYGIRGADVCNMCHTPNTCSRSGCHTGKAYSRISGGN
jgi:hypothetical protein